MRELQFFLKWIDLQNRDNKRLRIFLPKTRFKLSVINNKFRIKLIKLRNKLKCAVNFSKLTKNQNYARRTDLSSPQKTFKFRVLL